MTSKTWSYKVTATLIKVIITITALILFLTITLILNIIQTLPVILRFPQSLVMEQTSPIVILIYGRWRLLLKLSLFLIYSFLVINNKLLTCDVKQNRLHYLQKDFYTTFVSFLLPSRGVVLTVLLIHRHQPKTTNSSKTKMVHIRAVN